MTLRHPALLPALLAVGASAWPVAGLAAERGCSAMAIEPNADFQQQFPDVLDRIERELRARPDIDACARVELQLGEHDRIDVSVTLPDGRSASRRLTRRDDVVPTLQALLLVPAQPPVVVTAAAAPIPTWQAPTLQPAARGDRDVMASVPPAARELGFELSVVTGARVGDGQLGYGVGALSFLEVSSWLIGFQGRADRYRALGGGDPETALELGILGGKRFELGSMALDFTLGPGVAIKGLAFSDTEVVPASSMPPPRPPPMPSRSEQHSSGPVPRLLLGVRLGFSPRSVFRSFVGIDGELGPPREPVSAEEIVSSPRMPRYTLGLALGATVGTP